MKASARTPTPAKSLERRFRSWRPYAYLIILGALVFARTIWFNYVYFDDDILILKNFNSLQSLSSISHAFGSLYFGPYYRPIVTISLILDAQVSGMSPWMYHCSNLIYHLVASCLCFLLLSKLQSSRGIAFFASALFAVHPLITQTVAWIPGRNDSLVAIFIMLSFLSMTRSATTGEMRFTLLHILFFFLALLTKESALAFPLLCLYYLFVFVRVPVVSMKSVQYVAGWIGAVTLWYFMREAALSGLHRAYTLGTLVSNLRTVAESLGKMIVPVRLSPYATNDNLSLTIGIVAAVVILTVMALNKNARSRLSIFGILWLVLSILPSLVVHIADSAHRFSYLESRAYLSVAGVSMFIAGVFETNLVRLQSWVTRSFLLLIILFSIIAFRYSTVFHDDISHWEYATRMAPQAAEAYYCLGVAYMHEKDLRKAIESYEHAVELDSSNFAYHNNLGIAYGQQNLLEKAELEFATAARQNPSDPMAWSNLGLVSYLKHDLAGAESNLKKSLAADSTFTDALRMLISLYSSKGDRDQVTYYSEKLRNAMMMQGLPTKPK